jgi:hypothetical protein
VSTPIAHEPRTAADDAHAAAVRALVATALGPVLAPALLLAPVLALGSLLRTRRLRTVLADPDRPRRLGRLALVVGLGQLAAALAYVALVGWILVR